ncbi:hypothetical protein WJX72_000123 [[Myrmecia] bisecta]|uniref:UBX domain-containing protein n=1 Tax=[Myrmecia] bisecta TaxID=41462 RepID=A0AAW1PVD2_9CHLO
MSALNEEAIANFVAITGADVSQATTMLEATNFDLSQAVDLFFASAGEDLAPSDHDADAKMARELAGQLGGPSGGDQEVRAPIPIKKDRLYGDEFQLPHHRQASRAIPAAPMHGLDAFRDFRAEEQGLDGRPGGSQGLAGLFEPPRDIMFSGDFDQAKALAVDKGQWLLVNVQTNNEFASHMLNRDTWGDETVKSIIKGSFVFYQVYQAAELGSKVVTFYRLTELPAILVIDPVTGAMLRQFNGFIEAERLVEELVPFMDHNIHDPAAARLANPHMKRQRTASTSQRSLGAEAKPQALNEEDELAMALAMSMEDSGQRTGGGGASTSAAQAATRPAASKQAQQPLVSTPAAANGSSVGQVGSRPGEAGAAAVQAEPAASKPAGKSASEVAAAAQAALPAEPAVGDPDGCRVAVRLSDGRRVQRRFFRSAAVQSLFDFCISECAEAAAGRRFSLAHAGPGGATPLTDLSQTLEQAGAANAMLVMQWSS